MTTAERIAAQKYGEWTDTQRRFLNTWKKFWSVRPDWNSVNWGLDCSAVQHFEFAETVRDWVCVERAMVKLDRDGQDKFGPPLGLLRREYTNQHDLAHGGTAYTGPHGTPSDGRQPATVAQVHEMAEALIRGAWNVPQTTQRATQRDDNGRTRVRTGADGSAGVAGIDSDEREG